jgi:DNA-binding NtrC family response regulator
MKAATRHGTMKLLLVEDEEILRVSLAKELGRAGHAVEAHDRPPAALAALGAGSFDAAIADIRLPGMDGFAFMEEAQRLRPGLPFVFVTAFATVRDAVRAMRLGAFDYLTKPFEVEELLVLLERIRSVRALKDENEALRRRVEAMARDTELGNAPAMQRILDDLPLVAASDETVLITGETGTGKEHLSRLVHARSRRAEGPFVKASCAAFNPELIESELFGHEKGAFTGADARRIGRFERAQGGTIMLDDVDDVPLGMQVKLLSVLQDGAVERVGGERPIRVDVRLVVATKADLAKLVEAGRFRRDLYYRVNVLPMHLPRLRERASDIPTLVEAFLRRHGAGRTFAVAPAALDALVGYAWPGNIRELENLVKRLVVMAPGGQIGIEDLPEHVREPAVAGAATESRYTEAVARLERDLFLDALSRAQGNVTRAAEELGLPPSTFRDKLGRLGIQR